MIIDTGADQKKVTHVILVQSLADYSEFIVQWLKYSHLIDTSPPCSSKVVADLVVGAGIFVICQPISATSDNNWGSNNETIYSVT